MTEEEQAYLLSFVSTAPPWRKVPGRDREMLYRLALTTGLRAGELRSLTRRSFILEKEPVVVVEAAYSKHRRTDHQPIPSALVSPLTVWLRTRPVGAPVFDYLPLKPVVMLRHDLNASRAAYVENGGENEGFLCYQNADGFLDFHSLRHTFVTRLVSQRVDIAVVQKLARHATPILTLGIYAHTTNASTREAVECLDSPTVKRLQYHAG